MKSRSKFFAEPNFYHGRLARVLFGACFSQSGVCGKCRLSQHPICGVLQFFQRGRERKHFRLGRYVACAGLEPGVVGAEQRFYNFTVRCRPDAKKLPARAQHAMPDAVLEKRQKHLPHRVAQPAVEKFYRVGPEITPAADDPVVGIADLTLRVDQLEQTKNPFEVLLQALAQSTSQELDPLADPQGGNSVKQDHGLVVAFQLEDQQIRNLIWFKVCSGFLPADAAEGSQYFEADSAIDLL